MKGMEISRFYFNSGDIDSLTATDDTETTEAASDENSESDSDSENTLPTIGKVKKTDSIISNSIYKAGVGIKVHMYDKSFDLVSAQN